MLCIGLRRVPPPRALQLYPREAAARTRHVRGTMLYVNVYVVGTYSCTDSRTKWGNE